VGPAVCMRAAAKKVALGHFVLFPSYTVLFYGYMSTFEGKGLAGGMQKLRDTWWGCAS
jgi:protein Mpv17